MITNTKNKESCNLAKKDELLYCPKEEQRSDLKMFTKRKRKNSTNLLTSYRVRFKIKFKKNRVANHDRTKILECQDNNRKRRFQIINHNLKFYLFSFLKHSEIIKIHREINNKQLIKITRNLLNLKIQNSSLKAEKSTNVKSYKKHFDQIYFNPFENFFLFQRKASKEGIRQILFLNSTKKIVEISGLSNLSIYDENKTVSSYFTFANTYITHAKHLKNFADSSYISLFFIGKIIILSINLFTLNFEISKVNNEWDDLVYSKSSDTFLVSSVEGEIFFYRLFAIDDNSKTRYHKEQLNKIFLFQDSMVIIDLFDFSDSILVYKNFQCSKTKFTKEDCSLKIIDVKNRSCLFSLIGHEQPVIHVIHLNKINQKKDIVVTCDISSIIRVWNLSRRECFKVINYSFAILDLFHLCDIRYDLICAVVSDNEKENYNLGIILLSDILMNKSTNLLDLDTIIINLRSSVHDAGSYRNLTSLSHGLGKKFSVINSITDQYIFMTLLKEFTVRQYFYEID